MTHLKQGDKPRKGFGKWHVYICRHCGMGKHYISEKKWIKSYCSKTGKTVHLIRL